MADIMEYEDYTWELAIILNTENSSKISRYERANL